MKFLILSALFKDTAVAPLAGAWIEIPPSLTSPSTSESLPSRERGLKLTVRRKYTISTIVAPLAGAWIEIALEVFLKTAIGVAPLEGAWIEIVYY